MSLLLFAEPVKYELKHPISNEPTGLTLELVGTDDDSVYQAQLDVVKALRKTGTLEPHDLAMSLEAKINVLSACIVGWTNASEDFKAVFKKLGFEDDSFSREKALALISMKTANWIRMQIDAAISDKEVFFKPQTVN